MLVFTDSIGSTKKYLAPKIWRKFSLGHNLDHSNKRCWVLLACGIVYCVVQGGSNIWVCGWNPKVRPFKWKLVFSCGIVYYVARGGSNIWVCGWNPKVWPFKWKLLSSTFLWYCLLCCVGGSYFWVCGCYPKVWPFKWKLLSRLAFHIVYYAVQGARSLYHKFQDLKWYGFSHFRFALKSNKTLSE